jgi:hypothetical protein
VGNNLSQELAEGLLDLDLETQITIQLRNNHYPPVPYSMVQPCIDAIDAYNDGEHDKLIQLPTDGFDANGEPFQITWRGKTSAPAHALVEAHHLENWIIERELC